MTSSENSPDRQKQVRFSEYVLQKPPTPNPESYHAREIGEFGILDPSSYHHDLDNKFLDHHPYEEPRPTYSDVDYTNTMEDLDLKENPEVSSTLHAPSNSSLILDAEKKLEDQSQELNYNKLYEIPGEIYPEIDIDSAGTEALYAVVKKPFKSSSPDQEKDFEMEPRFLGQRGKIENAYQIEKTLEFGKSYGGDGKINFGDRYTSIQPGKVFGSTNEDFLAPERSRQVQSSYHDEPKPSDYVPKWRRPLSLDEEDSLAQPTVHKSPDFGDADTFVKPYSENRTDYKYSPVESNKDSQYRSIFLRNTPDIEIIKSSNSPVSQNLHSSPRLVSEGFHTHDIFLHDNRERRDLPKSANFKVMSMKERIHDTPREQMSNPSQFQNLKHFWNVEDKNQSKGDVDTSSNRILTDVLKRNKPTRADLRQRNSKEIPTDDLSLPNSFDSSLSEEEQTSHKVASWLAHTPPVYGAEQVDASEELVHPREEFMEDINKTLVDRNYQTKDFSSALQKLTEDALEAPNISKSEHQRSEEILNSPFKKPYLLDERKKMTTILVNSAEKTHPTSGFYDRVVQVSSKQSPEKETKIAVDIPAVTWKQYPKEKIEESVERSVAPTKTENELKIVFQKLTGDYESNESNNEPQVEESSRPNEDQQLVETKEVIERSSIPKGNDHQEFRSALNRLEIEASTPPAIEEEYEQPEKVLTLNTGSPVKSSFKIGFEHMMPTEHDTLETPQKNNIAYSVQSYPPYFDEVVEKTTAPSRKDEDDLRASLKKLEQEAALPDPSGALEDSYENTQPLKSTGNITTVHSFTIPSFDAQKMPSPSRSLEDKSNLDDLYANRTKKSTENVVIAYVDKAKEKTKYTFQEKLPVEEEPLQKTIVTTEESRADYRNRIMRLEEEAAASVPAEPEDLSEGETFHVSPAPMKDVFISKKVFSNNESMPTELPLPQPYAYDKMANSPQSPSDQTGSFTGSAENIRSQTLLLKNQTQRKFGTSGSGCGKIQSSSINDDPSQTYPQFLMDGEIEKDKESLENEKEHSVLKEKIASLDVEDTGELLVDERKDQNEVLISALEKSEHPSSKKSDEDKSVMQQRRVGDIKLLWEGVGASPDAAKQPVLSNTKHTFSPVDLLVTPKSSSLDVKDQNVTSLVTFKKVIVEDEEDPMYPVNQLKSFWENEKNKNTMKDKPDRESMINEGRSDDKGATSEDPRSKFKKWHTIHNFFNEDKSIDLIRKIPGRSISLGDSANESLKDHIKPASFQNLKHFWTTSSKLDNKKNNQALPENTKNQFGSNPDIRSKESFVSRAKGRLAAKSLQDIREDPSSVNQYYMYNAEPFTRKFIKGNGQNEYTQNAVNGIKTEKNSSSVIGGNYKLGKPISSINVIAQESSLPSNHSKTDTIPDNCESKQDPGIAEEKQKALTDIEKSVAPKKSEISLKLKTLQHEEQSTNFNMPDKGPQATIFENYPKDNTVYRDEENGEINEKGRKMFLVKQNGFDSCSPAFSNVSGSPRQNEENLSEKEPIGNEQISDSSEVVNEHIEKTAIPLNRDLCDFDKKLQNLYNESLNLDDSQTGYLTEPKYMYINEPDENFSKVLAISSDKNIQSYGGEKSHQPIIVNISSTKTEIGNEALSKSEPDSPTETSLIKSSPSAEIPMELGHLKQKVDVSPSEATNTTSEEPTSELMGSLARDPEVEEFSSEPNYSKVTASQPEKINKKEITEIIEMPVILHRTHSNYFDEKLKQLYEESQNSESNLKETTDCDAVAKNNENVGEPNKDNVYLYSTEPKKTFLESSNRILKSSQTVLSDRETLTDESAPSRSQALDILVPTVNETIEKTIAPTRISAVKGFEEHKKEVLNEEEGGLVGNVTSDHVAINKSPSKLSDLALEKYSVSEGFPREKDTAQEATEAPRYEEHQEVPSETSITFMSDRQSTPVKDKNGSLRRSTLELYLETPYRREISKSIDVDFSGYVPSEVNKCMDESHPILNALKRSAAKTLNSKAVQEVSPTSTNEDKLENPKEDTLAPLENSFPENAEKFKRMSQSVPTFLQDDTDGRETDSASESSFQIGRHKKSPSSLTNLSGSSGMASMSSVSGSVMSVYSGDFGNVDIKGNIEYSIEYVEQLKEFLIYIYQCKDLAAADVKKQRSDPYVKAYLLPEKAKMGKRKTAVKKKTLNPVYNEILRYKIPKESLQAQTLNLSVWHRDVLGRNSFLGEVNQDLANWEWENKQKNWYPLEPRTLASSIGLENRGEMKLSLQYIPVSPSEVGKKPNTTGEVHIWIRECIQLPMLRENKINSFVKCTILPDTSRKSRQKTRTVDKTPNPIFNHTMVYDGFKEDDLREACVELTVWDHNKLTNHFLGGIRIGQGTGKSYGTPVDWMDSSPEESTMWQKMIASPNTWIDGMLPLRMFKMAKLAK
ncbi:unnamed protein product [Ranitomeya imitator]|uniref:C2 domain-containing protein n=1 Tax=Ranitomeya imitator TaxID=111125 RepID=A0ABN9LL29_9NEOB|nr:unnamed protein product [Ranitomeya imitator]